MTTSGKSISPEVVEAVLSCSNRWCKTQRRLVERISLAAGKAVWDRRMQATVELLGVGHWLLRIEFLPITDNHLLKQWYVLFCHIFPNIPQRQHHYEMRVTKYVYASKERLTLVC